MAKATIAVIQTKFSPNREKNVEHALGLVEQAAKKGGQVILLPELFETPYFPREMKKEYFDLARPLEGNETIRRFQSLAEKHRVALPISFFEKDGADFYNSIAFVDEKGKIQGLYRKTFIPSGPGYEEKFYFKSGNTGFKVWPTGFGKIGVGICWDQWFPEAAREMALQGADVLLYPTCIGSEPETPHLDTQGPWQRSMIGHAVANVIPVAAANRTGTEGGQTYYGSSFIVDHRGAFLAQADRTNETILTATLDFAKNADDRRHFALHEDLALFYGKPAKKL